MTMAAGGDETPGPTADIIYGRIREMYDKLLPAKPPTYNHRTAGKPPTLDDVHPTDILNITRGPYAPLVVSARIARREAPDLRAGDFTAECTPLCPVKIYP